MTSVHLDKEPKPIQWSEGSEKGKPEAGKESADNTSEERGQKAVAETFEKIKSTLAKAIGRISNASEHLKSAGDFTAAASDSSIKAFSSIYRGPNKIAEWLGDENAHMIDIIDPKYSALKSKAVDGMEAITAGYTKAIDELSNRFGGVEIWKQNMHENLGLSGAKKAQIEIVPEISATETPSSEDTAKEEITHEETTHEETLPESSVAQAEPQPPAWKPISFGESLARFMKDESTGPKVDAEQSQASPVVEASKVEMPVREYKVLSEQEMRAIMTDSQAQIGALLESDTSINPATDKNKMEKMAQLRMVIGHYEKELERNAALNSSLDTNAAAGQETNKGVA